MKALAITIIFFATLFQAQANNTTSAFGKPKAFSKELGLKKALDQQINKHIYFPSAMQHVDGEATVMLQTLPNGDVVAVLVQTTNSGMKDFIENQVKKIKVDKAVATEGQIFKYRFVFKANQ